VKYFCQLLLDKLAHKFLEYFTVSTVDFEMPLCKLYLLFISANAAKKNKKEKKVLQPTVV
jgi:hypothetical protein